MFLYVIYIYIHRVFEVYQTLEYRFFFLQKQVRRIVDENRVTRCVYTISVQGENLEQATK